MKITNSKFTEAIAEILGDNFFLCDTIDQEELFDMQSKLAKLICNAANQNLPIAKSMVKKLNKTFQTS
tara:strand:+ start:599 stop:802 length:204 start_codon:yes stop_codon:yes gene_type:complete